MAEFVMMDAASSTARRQIISRTRGTNTEQPKKKKTNTECVYIQFIIRLQQNIRVRQYSDQCVYLVLGDQTLGKLWEFTQ